MNPVGLQAAIILLHKIKLKKIKIRFEQQLRGQLAEGKNRYICMYVFSLKCITACVTSDSVCSNH